MLYVDSADLKDIEWWILNGGCSGVTTNPGIIRRDAPGADVEQHLAAIASFLAEADLAYPLHVQIAPGEDPERYTSIGPNIVVKCPISRWGLEAAACCPGRVNITAIVSVEQAAIALATGARFISIFWGRILDSQRNPADVAERVRASMTFNGQQIIVGSIRAPRDVTRALRSGAHIVTARPEILAAMMQHDATDKILAEWYP